MTDVPFADPAPRRRRDRDRAADAQGSTDSWAHLVGLGGRTADDEAESTPPSAADETRRPGPAEPLSRRAARLREARTDGDQPGAHLSTGGSPTVSESVPLRPWWASPADREPDRQLDHQLDHQLGHRLDRPAEPSAEVPPAFRRSSPPPVPPDLAPEPPAQLVREQPQVNPWPGTVRPALPVPGAVSGRRASGRTSDLVLDVSAARESVAPPGTPLAPAEIELPSDVRDRGHRTHRRPEAEVRLPEEVSATARGDSTAAPVLGRPVLPSAALPGPVLPGVERAVEPGQEPPVRRSTRAGEAIRLPSTPGVSTGELDLRLVRDVAAARSGRSEASSARRRLGATPVRFPALGPAGQPLAVEDTPHPPASSRAAARTGSSTALSSGPADVAAAGTDALDVVAGIGPAGRTSRRRISPDEARSRTGELPAASRHGRGHTRSSRPPLRPVDSPTGDEATRLLRPVLSDGAEDDSPAPAGKAPGPSPVPDGAPDAPLPGTRSRRAAASRRSSGSTAALSAVPAPATSRAGRNLPAAIAVGLGLGGAVLASLLWRKEAFVVVVAAAVLMALWELTGALAKKSVTVPIVPLAVGAVGMLVSAYVAGEDGLLVSFTLTAFGVLLWRIIDGTQGAARDVAAAVFVAAYVPFLAGFATLMLASADGAYRVIVFIAVTVANDVGGYAAGVLFGRHPMAPSISPKKSWEGVSGSFALCMLVGAGTVSVLLHGSLLAGLAVGAAAAFTATLGDLSESLLKRDLGIKDMGTLLPGHGGMMDRLDSLLPTAPAVALLLAWLVPVAAR